MQPDAPSYVERQADKAIFQYLVAGEFCYALTSRQMGKSSLMVRTVKRLREQGIKVAVLDLTAIGQNLTPEQWYDGLLAKLGRQLGLEDELDEFWRSTERFGPLQRWSAALEDVIVRRFHGPIVIFIDELDVVRSLSFSTDEFFAALRECYNRRSHDAEFHRLTFCLMGVAAPTDLIRDTRLTPFNIGRRIELNDFAEAEAAGLARGLNPNEQIAQRLLQRVLHWTSGQPYLTQRLCCALAGDRNATNPSDVDRYCAELFLSPKARERDDNLIFVRERMLNSEVDRAELLIQYGEVIKGKRVPDDEANPLVSVLRLSGITKSDDGRLCVRNRIYELVFDRNWVTVNMPDTEVRSTRCRSRIGDTAG